METKYRPPSLVVFAMRWIVLGLASVFVLVMVVLGNVGLWQDGVGLWQDRMEVGDWIGIFFIWGLRIFVGPVIAIILLVIPVSFLADEYKLYTLVRGNVSRDPAAASQQLLAYVQSFPLFEFVNWPIGQRNIALRALEAASAECGKSFDAEGFQRAVRELQAEWRHANRAFRAVDATSGKDHLESTREEFLRKIENRYQELVKSLEK